MTATFAGALAIIILGLGGAALVYCALVVSGRISRGRGE